MRIHLNLKAASSSSDSASHASNLPPSIVRLTPSNELVLIELQGALDMEDLDPRGGQQLARLTFEKGREDKPTLLISHHRLEGRIVNLVKPLAVLEKRTRDAPKEENEANEVEDSRGPGPEGKRVSQINSSPIGMRNHQNQTNSTLAGGSDDEDEVEELDENNLSPTTLKKRSNPSNANPNPSKKSKISDEKGKGMGMEGMELETPSKSRIHRKEEDSSPMPLATKRGEALDFSSPQSVRKPSKLSTRGQGSNNQDDDENEDDDEGGNGDEISLKPTSTSYDMVCIITKKILFDKRPEPVVRLEGAEGIEMAKTLGIKT